MNMRDFWAKEAAKMRDTSHLGINMTDSTMEEEKDSYKIIAYISTEVEEANLETIIENVKAIFDKNKIVGIKYLPILPKDARAKKFDEQQNLMITIVDRNPNSQGENQASPGNTLLEIKSVGARYFMDIQKGTEIIKNRAVTYVNYFSAKEFARKDKGNVMYKVAYLIAHEFLHQLCAKALTKKGENTYYNHTNHVINLNQDGKHTNIPKFPSPKSVLHKEERILPEMQQSIQKYINSIASIEK